MLHTLILGGERPILTPYPDPDRSIYLGVLFLSLVLSTPSCHVSPPQHTAHTCSDFIRTGPGAGGWSPRPAQSGKLRHREIS